MDSIITSNSTTHFDERAYQELNTYIADKAPSVIFLLVDSNTMEHCYPHFMPMLETSARIEVIEIDAGEEFKNIETCSGVWAAMIELGCDRQSLMINLGGGVVTDLGGFVASTIKRGIDFIHIPTTVLGMVDAAIGGKNGVDLGHLKNQVGVIQPPVMTLIDTNFLQTLPKKHLRNGSIEMFKHGLIADRDYWQKMLLINSQYYTDRFDSLIHGSVEIKSGIVQDDPTEKGARKALNYGHTIGHAIESYCLSSDKHVNLLHGEAIAIGIYLESFLSTKHSGLSRAEFEEIENWYQPLELSASFSDSEVDEMIDIMSHDKKNVNGQIRFVLLEKIGTFKTDVHLQAQQIKKAFELL
ncbi:3-dehydroquinate synthase [Nonlabens spongiae]|uniref:3-dehydroquinate synthase n=1 Tax=Nonlabens spongiae TaxID=331648 RepID=A0A1W6MJ27_9FLAO|nr:3-dehydroquinate synthase [Nonlabens spongiae]ARN77592.1 3-dehydroquinate synthase [Nonlabens spongiae]